MEKLNLPVFKGSLPEGRSLSMDDYLKFTILNLRYIINTKEANKLKGKLNVSVPFKIINL